MKQMPLGTMEVIRCPFLPSFKQICIAVGKVIEVKCRLLQKLASARGKVEENVIATAGKTGHRLIIPDIGRSLAAMGARRVGHKNIDKTP